MNNNNNTNNWKDILTTSVKFKTAKRSQGPGDDIVLKRFFCDNIFIFRRRSKGIPFL